jgi:hypothetical protein
MFSRGSAKCESAQKFGIFPPKLNRKRYPLMSWVRIHERTHPIALPVSESFRTDGRGDRRWVTPKCVCVLHCLTARPFPLRNPCPQSRKRRPSKVREDSVFSRRDSNGARVDPQPLRRPPSPWRPRYELCAVWFGFGSAEISNCDAAVSRRRTWLRRQRSGRWSICVLLLSTNTGLCAGVH